MGSSRALFTNPTSNDANTFTSGNVVLVNQAETSDNQAMIETTALNAAGGLIVANIANNFEEGVELAMNIISNGKAFKTLENFVKDTGDIAKLKEMI